MDQLIERIMRADYIKLSYPLFIGLIAFEMFYTQRHKLAFYRVNDTINSLSCGVFQQLLDFFIKAFFVGVYIDVYDRFAVHWVESLSPWQKAGAGFSLWLAVDFAYYWFHRIAHETNIGWASHVVHHQSEEYNLSTALRQSASQQFFSFWFYLPLAFAGFPPAWFVSMVALNTVFQFWVHTRAVRKFPAWFELVFNTPSHHRVHHGRNPRYIDRNHAGSLIIWDRMFGTFQAEDEEAVFGITTPLASWNPLWAQVQYYVDLWQQMARAHGIKDKLMVLMMPPGWRPSYLGPKLLPPEVDARTAIKFDPVVSTQRKILGTIIFTIGLLSSFPIYFLPDLGLLAQIGFAATACSLLLIAGALNNPRWGRATSERGV